MEKEKIELENERFMSTLNFDKLASIAEFIDKDNCHFLEIWEDYGGIGDVAIFEIDGKYGKQKIAYGEYGRVEVGHIDLNTNQWVEPKFLTPNNVKDFLWFTAVAIYTRFYTKNGKNYLDLVEDVTLSSIKNRKYETKNEFISAMQLKQYLTNVFKELKLTYEESVKKIGDTVFLGEEQSMPQMFFIIRE